MPANVLPLEIGYALVWVAVIGDPRRPHPPRRR